MWVNGTRTFYLNDVEGIETLSCSRSDSSLSLRSLVELRSQICKPELTHRAYVLGDLALGRLMLDPHLFNLLNPASVVEKRQGFFGSFYDGTAIYRVYNHEFPNFALGAVALLDLRLDRQQNRMDLLQAIYHKTC